MATQAPITLSPEGAVIIPYPAIISAPETLQDALGQAFGSAPDCLGIVIVTDLPKEYAGYRERLLKLADRFASLDEATREKYSDPKTRYSFGWSHGKEIMNGKPDTLKGSYYANPMVDIPTIDPAEQASHPEYYGENIWPSADEKGVEGFEDAFKDLGRFVFKIGTELAGACQSFASEHLQNLGVTLPGLLKSPGTVKARLLHYFPPPSDLPQTKPDDVPLDAWCGTHLDHSMLTGLCSAMFLDHPEDGSSPVVIKNPSPTSGLYIKTRGGKTVKVNIPVDCLAFQTGESLELATEGRLRATPHFVSVSPDLGSTVSRETFALFMQPETTQTLSKEETFGSFSKKIFEKHYGPDGAIGVAA